MPSIRNHRKTEKAGVQETKPGGSKTKIYGLIECKWSELATVDKAGTRNSIL